MADVRSEKIAKAEEGLDKMQDVLDHAKRAVDATTVMTTSCNVRSSPAVLLGRALRTE